MREVFSFCALALMLIVTDLSASDSYCSKDEFDGKKACVIVLDKLLPPSPDFGIIVTAVPEDNAYLMAVNYFGNDWRFFSGDLQVKVDDQQPKRFSMLEAPDRRAFRGGSVYESNKYIIDFDLLQRMATARKVQFRLGSRSGYEDVQIDSISTLLNLAAFNSEAARQPK